MSFSLSSKGRRPHSTVRARHSRAPSRGAFPVLAPRRQSVQADHRGVGLSCPYGDFVSSKGVPRFLSGIYDWLLRHVCIIDFVALILVPWCASLSFSRFACFTYSIDAQSASVLCVPMARPHQFLAGMEWNRIKCACCVSSASFWLCFYGIKKAKVSTCVECVHVKDLGSQMILELLVLLLLHRFVPCVVFTFPLSAHCGGRSEQQWRRLSMDRRHCQRVVRSIVADQSR